MRPGSRWASQSLSAATLRRGPQFLSSPKPCTITVATIYFTFQEGHYFSGGTVAAPALDSKKRNPRLLSRMKKPRWRPKLCAVEEELASPTGTAPRSAQLDSAADAGEVGTLH